MNGKEEKKIQHRQERIKNMEGTKERGKKIKREGN